MRKKIKSMCVDGKVYDDFVIYAKSIGRSASSMLEQYMRTKLQKMRKEIKNEKNEEKIKD